MFFFKNHAENEMETSSKPLYDYSKSFMQGKTSGLQLHFNII